MTPDPFTALGLPVRPDLTDDDVRVAWRRIAAATHPDRADGGDPGRYAVAAAAYTDLRTRYGRGEAYADLAAGNRWRRDPATPAQRSHTSSVSADAGGRPARARASGPAAASVRASAADPAARPPRAAAAAASPGGPRARRNSAAALASRVRRGRSALLALRVAITAVVCAAAFAVVGAQPAAAGLATGALTWLMLTGRHDLMPPGS